MQIQHNLNKEKYMYDYHSHTHFSSDCDAEMSTMIDAAYARGIRQLAITDHYDPCYPDLSFPFELDFENYHKALNDAKIRNKDRIQIKKGIEIGIQHGDILKMCSQAVQAFDYDFVIGSFHSSEGIEIDSKRFYEDRSNKESYIAFYTYMHNALNQYFDYDVIGHFNIIDRYAASRPKDAVYMDIIEEILKTIIYQGKGIEINTSSFRYNMGERTTPAKEILKLYKDLGGEIITIGSDSHRPDDLGYRYDTAVEMILSTGFKYLATFEQRKVSFEKL